MAADAKSLAHDIDRTNPGALTVKLSDLTNSVGALQQLAAQPMAAKVTFQLSKVLAAVNKQLAHFEEARKALNERYGTLNEAENRYDIRPEDIAKWETEYKELLDTEVELSISPVKLDSIANAQMSAGAMLALGWLIVEN